jgi:RNA polymerase sigma factor (sigma-70 family)
MTDSSSWTDNSAKIKAAVETHEGALRRYFQRRIRSLSDVDDLIQDVYFRLVRRGGISDISHVQAYLFQTANSVLRDHKRRNATHCASAHEPQKEELEDEEPSPERVLIGKESVEQFANALRELPERTRTIFVLCRLNDLDYKTIGKLQGISVSAVEKHVAKALIHLALRLKD